jgi:hypothetical protein
VHKVEHFEDQGQARRRRIETEFEVDQNVNGQRWNVVLRRNSRVVFSGVRTTSGPSGSFELRRLLSNSPGRDRISATARALRGVERCTASTLASFVEA